MSRRDILMFTYLISALVYSWAAPKPFSCMSLMEDDRTLMEEDEDDSEENAGNHQLDVPELTVTDFESASNRQSIPFIPHLRICPTDYTFCFSLWRQTENGSHIEKQDSTEGNATCSHSECVSSSPTSRNTSLYYCCCSGEACNRNVAVVESSPLQLSKPQFAVSKNYYETHDVLNWSTTNLWLAIMTACLIITTVTSFIYCRTAREKSEPEEAPLAPSGPGYSSNLRNVDNLNLICMLGSGKYGTVMKGLLHDQEVAVKIFPEAHHQYFINERNIYSLPLMESPALLAYFGFDERQTLEGRMEYQLVLSLAPLGNLQDWLIANTMNFEIFCGMVKSITRGLSHLHTELKRAEDHKPCIAHRDLNTRNILVKSDRTCCISDFGFALKVFGSRYEYKGEIAEAETKSINEVGTLRYMAPELLEGAVNLRDCEASLKQMDVYALGLVLWEVATRCTDFYPVAQITPPYKAPYELEVGSHPSFDQMQSLVVRHKARPLFPNGWGGGSAAKLVRDTCEDCWDHDAEARLTSLCAEERMHEVQNMGLRLNHHLTATTPLLSANNLCKEIADSNDSPNHNDTIPHQIDINCSDTSTLLNPPPNKKILPPQTIEIVDTDQSTSNSVIIEKNHLIQTQLQLQPYQGRNPCLERNLAPVSARSPQRLIQRSKKHSFQSQAGEEHSLSCLEDDVSVEELITGGNSKKFPSLTREETSNMGQGFPKQHNTDKKLKGWHGVRALIQKRLFRKSEDSGVQVFRQINGGDEKSSLVDNRQVAVLKGLDKNATAHPVVISFIDNEQTTHCVKPAQYKTTVECNGNGVIRRPNNLDLSPLSGSNSMKQSSPPNIPSNQISTITEEENDNNYEGVDQRLKSLNERRSTPSRIIPRSNSSNLKPIENIYNNMYESSGFEILRHTNSLKEAAERNHSMSEPQFRRQRSLEVFREVFNARASSERLRNPSQRVKTPGDVPPSVRKVRASKTLSLYDDRMMDPTSLNVL
uniref:Serine/threonine-protein kinase receptor n=1 Tax=Glossina brevipalpis TaxID=37001 RepID=A0A1A9W4R0_9MUSC